MRKPVDRYARRLLCLLTVAVCVLSDSPASAQTPMAELARKVGMQIVAEGTSTRRLKNQSIKQIPLHRMSNSSRRRVREVIRNCAQYRRLPELRYVVQPKIYRYLIEHPDVAVSTWRAMDISKIQFWQTGPVNYEATAPDGSLGQATVLYRDDTQCLMLCDGTYSSPLLPRPITAAGLVWMRCDYRPDKAGRTQVIQRLDVFVSFPSATARTMAALASPITNMMMDRNAFEVSLYARMMSQAAESDPEWVEEIARRMDGVLPQRRQELASIVRPVETSRDRTAAVSGRPISSSRPARMFRASLISVQPPSADEPNGEVEPGTGEAPGIHNMADPMPRTEFIRTADSTDSETGCDEPSPTDGATEEDTPPAESPCCEGTAGGWRARRPKKLSVLKQL